MMEAGGRFRPIPPYPCVLINMWRLVVTYNQPTHMASLASKAKFGNAYPRKPFVAGNVSSLLRPVKHRLCSNAATDDPGPAVSSAKTVRSARTILPQVLPLHEPLPIPMQMDEKDHEIRSLKSQLEKERAGRARDLVWVRTRAQQALEYYHCCNLYR